MCVNKQNDYFIIKDVLLYYDYPIVFTLTDSISNYYLALSIDSKDNQLPAVATRVSSLTLDAVLSGKVDIRSIFTLLRITDWLFFPDLYDLDNYSFHSENIPEDFLPEHGCYLYE